ncbi:MAG TPA: EAL domain-containing protein [Clostridiaceae bacterium]|nr:EAL domain-containing protein [Clostridiaceae bacterium]
MQFEEIERSIDISNLTCWYQPIYDLKKGMLLGYETLVRSKIKNGPNPMEIFKRAELLGRHSILDKQLIIKAQELFKCPKNCTLFINIFPSTIMNENFLSWWDEHPPIVDSIVLEISESEPVSNPDLLKFILKKLQQRGIKIALDDMGAGYSSLQRWIELEPDYIKLDKYYIAGIENYTKKQKLLKLLNKLFESSAQIIVEGVENIEGLKIAKDSGIRYAQGYLLGRPSPISNINDSNLSLL